ncbi:MAG: hypothetical protein LBU12_05900 [Deltaproteobacteria bacterium]|jgi:uncharacterized membrane-anchored protein YhcB (DUF1043 family)|nr:hypothetical protein [Deltaproteobacteria bacterium]
MSTNNYDPSSQSSTITTKLVNTQYGDDDSGNGHGKGNGKSRFDSLERRLISIENSINEVKSDVNVLKTDVNVLKTDVSVLKSDVSVLKSDVIELKRFRWISIGFVFAGIAIGIAVLGIIVNIQSQSLYRASENYSDKVNTKLEIWKTEIDTKFEATNARIEALTKENQQTYQLVLETLKTVREAQSKTNNNN